MSSAVLSVEKRSSARTCPSAKLATVCVGQTRRAICGMAATAVGAAPQSRQARPSALRTTETGWAAPDQCAVSTSVNRSAALQTEKKGSFATSGTAGGRNPAVTMPTAASTNAFAIRRTIRAPFIAG